MPSLSKKQVPGDILTKANCRDGRYPTALIAENNPPVASLSTLSPSLQYLADWNATADGSQHAGYYPADADGAFTDLSGVDSDAFSAQTVTDSNVAFSPKTGDLWWDRANQMYSSTVPTGSPQRRGSGTVYTFTSDGLPMPVPFFDSPDGTRRLIYTDGSGYIGTLNIGTTGALSSSCLERSGIQADSENYKANICGSLASATLAAACLDKESTALAGWVDDQNLVCGSQGGGDDNIPSTLSAITFNDLGKITKTTPLIPPTHRQISDALVTPDGKYVEFLTTDPANGSTLYAVPTDGSGSHSDPSALWNGPSGNGQILGWTFGGITMYP